MSKILTKEEFSDHLHAYYTENYGEKDTDIWYEQPAVNVWVFGRDSKTITLKCHILTGKVEKFTEE
ncbi:MAG: hypothetical protein E7591_09340 [Ruminococcaceae bacterium]|nr:hypothetical protein [Oscillospiraceae bacterium]